MEELGFASIFMNEYGSGYVHEKKNVIALVANADYIPIVKFKQLFEMMAEEIQSGENSYSTFIFDKSALRTFHQPSMKWYFMEWKTEMLNYGLHQHFKILPQLEYFKKAVEAARKPLLMKFPKETLNQLTIEYYPSVEEALKASEK